MSEHESYLEELETENTRLREICHEHGIDPPPDGYEAEELRKGIQKLLESKDLNDGYDGDEMARRLQKLLDETDARDTLPVVMEKQRLEQRIAKLQQAMTVTAWHALGEGDDGEPRCDSCAASSTEEDNCPVMAIVEATECPFPEEGMDPLPVVREALASGSG